MNLFLLVLLIYITGLSFYFYFIKKTDYPGRFLSGFIIFLLLGVVMAFTVYKESVAKRELAQFVTPYNGDMNAIYTPSIPGDNSQTWQFESADSTDQVKLFYSEEENRKGWEVIRNFPVMTLRKENIIMRININSLKKTSITYTLSDKK